MSKKINLCAARAHRACLAILCAVALLGQTPGQLVPLVGTFRYPDGKPMAGSLRIQLSRSTASNTCTNPASTASFSGVTVAINTNGVLAPVSLFPSPCLAISTYSKATASLGPGAGTSTPGTFVIYDGSAAGAGDPTNHPAYNFGRLEVTVGTQPALGTANGPAMVATIFFKVASGLSCYIQAANPAAATSGVTYTINPSLAIAIAMPYKDSSGNAIPPLQTDVLYQWTFACVLPYTVDVFDQQQQKMYSGQWSVPITTFPVDVSTIDLTQLSPTDVNQRRTQ